MPNVAKAGGIMMASLFLSRVLGFIREAIISAKFGQTELTDAYNAAFSVPDTIFFLIAGGALSSAFIPVFTEYLTTDREDDAWKIFSTLATVLSLALIVLIGLCWVFAPALVNITAPGYIDQPELHAQVVRMARILLPAQFAFFMGGLLMGVLYAKQSFTVPGLGPNIYNIGIILGAIFIAEMVDPGVVGMSWGASIGAFAGSLLLPILVLRKVGLHFKPSFDVRHEGVRKVFKIMLPVIAGLSLPGVFMLILKAFSSKFGEGDLTALTYGNQMMQVPLGIFGQALALAVFPALSQFYAQGKMDMYRRQISGTLRTVLYLSVPAAAVMLAIPDVLVQTLYERGAFVHEDTMRTAVGLRMFAIGAAAWCLHPCLMRGWFSIQKTVPPVVMGTITTAVFFGLCFTVLNQGMPFYQLALAGSIAAILMMFMLLFRLNKEVGGINLPGLFTTFWKSAVAAAVMAGALMGAGVLIRTLPDVGRIVVLGFSLLLAMWLYYFITKWLKMPETKYFDRAVAKLNKKQEPDPDDSDQ